MSIIQEREFDPNNGTVNGTGGEAAGEPAIQLQQPEQPGAGEVGQLRQSNAQLKAEVQRLRDELTAERRRRTLEAELAAARAIDIEAARLLAEASMQGPSAMEPAAAVASLRKARPYLFERTTAAGAGYAPRADGGMGAADELGDLASVARSTGDRRALLRYLRARRES